MKSNLEKNKVIDVMLDLETMGNSTRPVVTEIAAVAFDRITGEEYARFHQGVDMQSSIDSGLLVSASTVEFWMKQDDEARVSFVASQANATTLAQALANFDGWVKALSKKGDLRFWGNGIMADNVWISSAFEAVRVDSPIKFWQHNDVRTVVDMGWMIGLPNYKKLEKFTGVKHNPVDDCLHQIKYLCKYLNHFNKLL